MIILDPKKKYNYHFYVSGIIGYPYLNQRIELSNKITCLGEIDILAVRDYFLDDKMKQYVREQVEETGPFITFDEDKITFEIQMFQPLYYEEVKEPHWYQKLFSKLNVTFSKLKIEVKNEMEWWKLWSSGRKYNG